MKSLLPVVLLGTWLFSPLASAQYVLPGGDNPGYADQMSVPASVPQSNLQELATPRTDPFAAYDYSLASRVPSAQRTAPIHTEMPMTPGQAMPLAPSASETYSEPLVTSGQSFAPVVPTSYPSEGSPAPLGNTDAALQPVGYTFAELAEGPSLTPWTKGGFQIVPYGYLWMVGAYNSSRVNAGSYSLFVFSDDQQGEDETVFDARSTRIGVDISGPAICLGGRTVKTGGKVEIDFQNATSQINKGTILLRHAYVELKNDCYRLVAGQTWDIISPLFPPTIMYTVGWGAGNMGYRRAQFRVERYLHLSDVNMITLQGSLNGGVVSDFTSDSTASGNPAGWPSIQGRLAWTYGWRGKGGRPITIGVSAHVGEQEFDYNDDADPAIERDDQIARTWSINVDLDAPITDRLSFSGEYFTGENLGTFLGGIVQGVDRDTGRSIYSTGGWIGLHYKWSDRWHSGFGYSVDDPSDVDLTTSASQRRYNQWYFGNLVYQVTDKFAVGLELSDWDTLFAGLSPGEAARVELMVKYGF